MLDAPTEEGREGARPKSQALFAWKLPGSPGFEMDRLSLGPGSVSESSATVSEYPFPDPFRSFVFPPAPLRCVRRVLLSPRTVLVESHAITFEV